MIESSTVNVGTLNLAVVPLIVKLPETVKSPEIVPPAADSFVLAVIKAELA